MAIITLILVSGILGFLIGVVGRSHDMPYWLCISISAVVGSFLGLIWP